MDVHYDNIAWYGADKRLLLANNLIIDNMIYGSVIMDAESNMFAMQLLDYIKENNVEIPVLELESEGVVPSDPDDMLVRAVKTAVQNYLDGTATTRDYDDAVSCISYLNSTDETCAKEAKIMLEFRDNCWEKCHEFLNKYQNREIPRPDPVTILEAMPKIEW